MASDLSTLFAVAESVSRPIYTTFPAADGKTVHAFLYGKDLPRSAATILAFHQAGSNAGEYDTIAPALVAAGFTVLAVDQRSGGHKFGRDNRTVAGGGRSTDFASAYPDLEAALAWAVDRGRTGPILIWGSSYSAALVFRLAADYPDKVAGVLSFSPGEYLGGPATVRVHAKELAVPVFVAAAPGSEAPAAALIADAARAVRWFPADAAHGSSMLREERNPTSWRDSWQAVLTFLSTWRPSAPAHSSDPDQSSR